ncbi:MAG: DUF2933 domain-containing protein [Rhodopila sp.]|nr:DUF2933 domain-containing protein [Rhodopila sp.]
MHDHTMHHDPDRQGPEQVPFWRTPRALLLGGFIAIAGFYLATQHTAHTLTALPFLVLLACPLMHFFMHHDHGGHQTHGSEDGSQARLISNDQANRRS